jgi:hypothetical protein
MTPVNIAPESIILDDRLQARVKVDEDLVAEYSEVLFAAWRDIAGYPFPPVEVYDISGKMYVVDGFHRVLAALRCEVKLETIPAVIRKGSMDDAVLAAVKSNATHGLRRSTADKRRAVEMLLDHPVHGKLGKQKIADLAGVSKPMVMDVIARREGTTTTTERKQARQPSRVESTPLPPKLPKSLVKLANMMTEAGIHPDQIKAVIARTLAERPQRQPVPRRSDAERLRDLAEKVGQRAGKVITIIAEDASSRTKRYAKIQGRIT